MSRGFPSMTALLGLLAVAGYQNRDKIAEMLGGAGKAAPAGGGQGGLGGLLGLVDEFNAERRETAGCTGDARFDFAFGAGDSGESRDRFSGTV